MDWLSIFANIAQVASFIWTILFEFYARRAVLSKAGQYFKIKFLKLNISIFLITFFIIFIALVLRAVTWIPVSEAGSPHHGLDLETYCTSLGYSTNISDKACISNIDTNDTCNKQYNKTDLSFHLLVPNDALTGVCSDPQGHSFGGISNMSDFCEHKYKGGPSVAEHIGTTWVCQTNIVTTIVCSWQYGVPDVQARKNDDGSWTCYSG